MEMKMSKKVLLIGHCGADSSFLKLAVQKVDRAVETVVVHGEEDLQKHLPSATLVLVNRLLDYGYDETEGAELIGRLARQWPGVRFMMVSNYEEAHQAAERAGGLRGFGKREIGTPRVTNLLSDALATPAPAAQS
jgi:two-component system, chemotaxis family, chemotaxis protein CheY